MVTVDWEIKFHCIHRASGDAPIKSSLIKINMKLKVKKGWGSPIKILTSSRKPQIEDSIRWRSLFWARAPLPGQDPEEEKAEEGPQSRSSFHKQQLISKQEWSTLESH